MYITPEVVRVGIYALVIWVLGIILGLWLSGALKRWWNQRPIKAQAKEKAKLLEQKTIEAVDELMTKIYEFLDTASSLRCSLTLNEIQAAINNIQTEWKRTHRNQLSIDTDLIEPIELVAIHNGEFEVRFDRAIIEHYRGLNEQSNPRYSSRNTV